MGRAAHVLLHVAHAGGGLQVQAAGVEHHPLADQGDQRQVGPVQLPADLDQAGRPVRSGGAPHGVDGRIVVFQQGVAGDDGDLGACALCNLAGDGLDLQRPHVGGGRVDHFAGQGAGGGDARDFGDVHTGRRDQPHGRPVRPGLIAVEDICPQQEGQGRQFRVLRGDLKPIQTAREPRRQSPHAHRIEGRARADDHLADLAVCVRYDQQLARLAFEPVQGAPAAGRAL
jgi:hypothetical protein